VIKPLAGAPAEPSAPARARSRSRPAALAVKLQTPTARASCSCRIAERKARSGCRGRARRAPADRSRQVGGQPETIGSLWQPKQEFESGRARGLNLSQYCERSRRSEVPSFPVCPDRILRRRWSRICTRPMRRRHVVVHRLAGGNSSSEGVPPQSRACNSVGARSTIRTPIRVKPIGGLRGVGGKADFRGRRQARRQTQTAASRRRSANGQNRPPAKVLCLTKRPFWVWRRHTFSRFRTVRESPVWIATLI
jgi:hypothetical protein